MINREEWLKNLSVKLSPIFNNHGYKVPDNIKVSCGFPSKGINSNVIGECWDITASKDKIIEIFITPKIDDQFEVASILIHEMCHAIISDPKVKHGKFFKEMATKVGLEGKMKTTYAGEELKTKLNNILSTMEKYPHGKLQSPTKLIKVRKKTIFEIKCNCGYSIKIKKQFLEMGLPTCICNSKMELDPNEDTSGE